MIRRAVHPLCTLPIGPGTEAGESGFDAPESASVSEQDCLSVLPCTSVTDASLAVCFKKVLSLHVYVRAGVQEAVLYTGRVVGSYDNTTDVL